MGKNANKNDVPLASIGEQTTVFNLTFWEMQRLENHCNILKDFVFTPLINGRRLHKNSKILSLKQEEIAEYGKQIEERRAKLHEFKNDPIATPLQKQETDELMLALIEETKKYNVKKYELNLYTLKISDYPDNAEKFGKKSIPMQDGTKVEVEYYPAFLELTDMIILD